MSYRPDPPELERAINMLREIYWREYGRGWRDAIDNIKRVAEMPPPDEPLREQVRDPKECLSAFL